MEMIPMCETKTPKWSYKITHPVTKARVSVGPFKDKEKAARRMEQAYGIRKHLSEYKIFDFTPTWNGWSDDEYKGEEIVKHYTLPVMK